jgi:hypothetical protein
MQSPFVIGRGGAQHHNESSSGGSSDFFSPVSINFFRRVRSEPCHQSKPPQQSERTSWIGARLSPIQSFDNDCYEPSHTAENTNMNHICDIERRHSSSSSLEDAPFVTERTNLLFGQRIGKRQRRNTTATTPYRLHPLWKHNETNDNYNYTSPDRNEPPSPSNIVLALNSRSPFPIFLCWASGLHLLSMGIYDISHILGLVADPTLSAERHLWSLPALTPPDETLLAFGCFDRSAYLRISLGRWLLQMLTSTVICTSVVDWLLLCVSWNMIAMALRSNISAKASIGTTKKQSLSTYLMSSNGTIGIFAASVFIGLVWTNTYERTMESTPLGLATVGTAGVLGNLGSRDISQRYQLYCMNVIWLLLSLVTPDHSVFAMAGSIALGSALGFTTETKTFPVETPGNCPANTQSRKLCFMIITWIATACAIAIVSVPMLTLAFPTTFGMIVE